MLEADMRKKICPIMSPRPQTSLSRGMFILCQGSDCLAFGSNPTKVFLAEDGKTVTLFNEKRRFYEESSCIAGPIPGKKDESGEFDAIVAKGWKKQGTGSGVHFTRKGEPNCWCDAMAGNAQCGYEAQ